MSTTTAIWPAPSATVAALIREGAAAFLDDPETLFETVDAAVLAATPSRLSADPSITAATMATNHANILHWAAANVRRPGEPVPANLSPAVVDIARDIVRRGLDDSTSLNTYRIGQNVAWRFWMARAFGLTEDPEVLRELLDVTARSIFSFVDETVEGIQDLIDAEREQLLHGTHAERLETVNLILEGAPITVARASERLRYELGARHTAAVVWSDADGALEPAAEALARAAGARAPFTVSASARTLWVWWADGDREPDTDVLPEGVRAAIGTTASGLDGFRRAHLDALATQRLMQRMPADRRIARYEDVQLVTLVAADDTRAADFVTHTLGDLATAPDDLRETLRVYLREGSSASRAARALYTHRNTVLNRLTRARELLPAPLEGRGLSVALALEVVHWLGPRP
ncbi:PucR family transcriptional regulator [Baekduia sp. Peel2402]|uniref:PucR family transcriptional regulator n=1 Tax=Baekduia sp. Peel2402 TaxID=3458296 RepID=UPI00403E97D8